MINKNELCMGTLGQLLDDAAIDYTRDGDGDIYVTGLHFNFWLALNEPKTRLQFTTYCDFKAGVAEEEALDAVNALNTDFIMTQFFVDRERMRLRGTYTLLAQDGLNRQQFLRSARMFAYVFDRAMRESVAASLLVQPADAESSQSADGQQEMVLN
jgi:hypothetical protein